MTAVSPIQSLPFGETTLTLDGSFGTLRALQQAFQEDIVAVQSRVFGMRFDEIVTLLALACGRSEFEIGSAILDEMDVAGAEYQTLKARLMGFLAIALAPNRDREKKRAEVEAMIEKAISASRGATTNGSPSASSAGNPENSGAPTSGN